MNPLARELALEARGLPLDELAQRLGVTEASARRLLSPLVDAGLVEEIDADVFITTPDGQRAVDDMRSSFGPLDEVSGS